MANDTEIRPALTAEEWAYVRARLEGGDSAAVIVGEWGDNTHGVAAIALHGQPFGFTREDVRALRVEYEREWAGVSTPNDGERLLSIAVRIVDLLPPDAECHAAAQGCGQASGFTKQDVQMCLDIYRLATIDEWPEDAERWKRLAERIEALLPPE